MAKYVVKRDGKKVAYEKQKIVDAVMLAAMVTSGNTRDCKLVSAEVADLVDKKLNELYGEKGKPTVEQVQDVVEKSLIECNFSDIAKEYILYREERNKVRVKKSDLMREMYDITFKSAADNDAKRENANIDGDTAMGTMLKYGGETAKEFNHLYLLDKDASQAHKSGDIHIHDLDFYSQTLTCVQTDLSRLFKNGFNTGHGYLREPGSIRSAGSLTAIALQSCQNDMHFLVL